MLGLSSPAKTLMLMANTDKARKQYFFFIERKFGKNGLVNFLLHQIYSDTLLLTNLK